MRGIIKRIIPKRGFGFIQTEGGRDVFFHRSAVQGRAFDRLKEGTAVEFDLEKTAKGPKARVVRPELAASAVGSKKEKPGAASNTPAA